MHSPLKIRLRSALLLAAATTAWSQLACAAASPLNFDRIFNEAGEPASLYFRAQYQAAGQTHALESWRRGHRQLRRRTDARIDNYVFRAGNGPEYQMTVLDQQRKIATRVSRTNLYRVGTDVDWFDLAHGLRHPIGDYRLESSAAPAGTPTPVARCRWYALNASSGESDICWSARHHLPLMIYAPASHQLLWQVTALSTQAIDPKTFQFSTVGFIDNDADRDIEPD